MNCKYCKCPCIHLTPVYYDGGGLAYKRMQCDSCPVRIEYYVNGDGTMADIRFMWEEKPNKRYRIFCNFEHNACMIQYQIYMEKWNIEEIELHFIPNWDPQTIKDKVKTYILFS